MTEKISHIFYINLNRRNDRKDEIISELTNMNLINKTERFEAIEDSYSPAGCLKSHLGCLELAKELNYDNILIFEDDFQFIVNNELFELKMDILMKDTSWDVLFLSYNPKKYDCIDDNIVRLYESQTASGYIVRSHYYDKLIDLYKENLPKLIQTRHHWLYMNDVCWFSLMKKDNFYGINPKIGLQRPSYSDLAQRNVNYGV
jgi:GR25 family glycosyltransferase involved in LPS biosynthesis